MANKKYLSFVLIITTLFFSYCSNDEKNYVDENNKHTIYTVQEFANNANTLIGKTIYIRGVVDHVCEHSGQRFRIIDRDGKAYVRIQLGKKETSIDPSNMGKIVEVKGKVESKTYSPEEVRQLEQKVIKAKQENKEIEHQGEALKLIEKLKADIQLGKTNTYSVYHIEAISYEIK